MRVFVAGATGAVGRPLVRMLVDGGHDVTALVRSDAGAAAMREAGVTPVSGDALDAGQVRQAVTEARPDAIVHQLTAIPARINPRTYERDMATTNRLRTEGTRNLVDAARAAGVRRLVAQSIAFAYRPGGDGLRSEDAPLWLDAPRPFTQAVAALEELETSVTRAEGLEGVVLRYGFFYGPGTSYAPDGSTADEVRRRRLPITGGGTGVFSFVHVDDAAAATVSTVEGPAAGVFNVVDDEPAPMHEWLPAYAAAVGARAPRRVPAFLARLVAGRWIVQMATEMPGASNARARRELGLSLRYPSWRTGFVEALG